MAKAYWFIGLTGGIEGYLDNFYANDLNDGDLGIVTDDTGMGLYFLDATSGVDERSPYIIKPDEASAGVPYTGDKRWALQPNRMNEVVYAAHYGVTADGTTDDSVALQEAINASGGTKPVVLPAGTIRCESVLTITVDRYYIRGARTEKGAGGSINADYHATVIQYRPSVGNNYLIHMSSTTASLYSNIGPFVHENIRFDLGDYNGLAFGDESIGAVVDGAGERYVYGVRFNDCAFSGTNEDLGSVSGVITRSGNIMLHLTKCFECLVQNCSFEGGNIQIRTWGCDKPTFRNIRFFLGHVAMSLRGSGFFTAQTVVECCQYEVWGIAAINSQDMFLCVDRCRFESGIGSLFGAEKGLYDLTTELGITASVTADSGTIVFSQSMTNILFPRETVLELTNSDGEVLYAMVDTVSDATVTIETTCTTVTWTDSNASVKRVHAYGVSHAGFYDAQIDNCSIDIFDASAPFIYTANRGSMSISNAMTQAGAGGGNSIAIGNRYAIANYVNQGMWFSNCTPNVLAPLGHAMVHSTNFRDNHGTGNYDNSFRSKQGNLDVEFHKALRKWSFTPRDTAHVNDNSQETPIIEVSGDEYTGQKYWCWYKRSGSSNLNLYDESVLSIADYNLIRYRIRARSASGSTTLTYYPVGTGGAAPYEVALTDTEWTLHENVRTVPTVWNGNRSFGPGIVLTGSGYYVASVTLEEVARELPYAHHITTLSDITLEKGQCFGSIIYVLSSNTITLPPVSRGMNLTVFTWGPQTVTIYPDSNDAFMINGAITSYGNKLINSGTSGDWITFRYTDAHVGGDANPIWVVVASSMVIDFTAETFLSNWTDGGA